MTELKQKRDKWRNELNEIRHSTASIEKQTELRGQMGSLENKVQMLQHAQKQDAAKLKAHEENIKSYNKQIKKLSPDLDQTGEQLKQQEDKVEELETQIGAIEERVFRKFSDKVGVRNIREYEENTLVQQQQHSEKKLTFQKNIRRLEAAMKLEQTRDKSAELGKIEKQVDGYADTLQELKQKHEQYCEQTATLESELEEQQSATESKSADVKRFDSEVKELRKALDSQRSAMAGQQKKVDSKETLAEQLRSKRHSLFQQTRLEEILLPLAEGKGEAAKEAAQSRRGGARDGPAKRRRTSDGHHKTGLRRDLDQTEQFLELDGSVDVSKATKDNGCVSVALSSVPDDKRRPVTQQDIEREADKYREQRKALIMEMEKISPNTRALDKFNEAEGRLKTMVDEFETARDKSKEAMQAFDTVKAKRHELFVAAFKHVAGCIDDVYKELTSSAKCPAGGTAVVTLENEDEPYLHGIRYYPQPPFKGFRDIDQLSGGEKSISALALLFAIHSFKPAPFFVLDEVDAALDTANVSQVAHFIKSKKNETQFVVISLKDHFYENADGLVGVCKNRPTQSSAIFTMDLAPYQEAVIPNA